MQFDSEQWAHWAAQRPELPLGAVAVYVLCIAQAPARAPSADAQALRRTLVVWNVAMAVFSALCTFIAVPHYLFGEAGVLRRGVVDSVCSDVGWYSQGPSGAVATAFTMSKFVELVDTLFLALRRRPLTKLHTFHHAATLLLTWRLFESRASTGLVFIAMNASVHTVMYSYFALMLFSKARKLVQPHSYLITVMQIAQMIIGVIVNLLATREIIQGRVCNVPPSCVALSGCLYTIYLVAFASFLATRMKEKRA